MPRPDENIETVTRFANEVFNEKNLQYAEDWLADDFVEHQVYPGTTPGKKGAIDSYRIFFDAVPDMKAEIHDLVAAGDRVALRATYSGTDKGGFIPGMPPTGRPFAMETMYIIRLNDEGRIAEHWGIGDSGRDGAARSSAISRRRAVRPDALP